MYPQGSFGAAVEGTESGGLVVDGDVPELRAQRSSRSISGIGRVGTKDGVWLTLPGVNASEIAIGHRRKHATMLTNDEYRAAAAGLVRRSQDAERRA